MEPTADNILFVHLLGVVGSIVHPRKVIEEQLLPVSLELLPELVQSVRLKQNHHHHLDVFDHTVAVVEQTKPQPLLRLAALFHDLGKVETRRVDEDGKITFHGHEDESAKIARRVLAFNPEKAEMVAWLCERHMDLKVAGPDGTGITDKSLKKLMQRAPDPRLLDMLLDLCHADNISHAPASCMPQQIKVIRKRMAAIQKKINETPKPVVSAFLNGNDLLALQPGRQAGPWVRNVLDAVAVAEKVDLVTTKEQAIEFALSRFGDGM